MNNVGKYLRIATIVFVVFAAVVDIAVVCISGVAVSRYLGDPEVRGMIAQGRWEPLSEAITIICCIAGVFTSVSGISVFCLLSGKLSAKATILSTTVFFAADVLSSAIGYFLTSMRMFDYSVLFMVTTCLLGAVLTTDLTLVLREKTKADETQEKTEETKKEE